MHLREKLRILDEKTTESQGTITEETPYIYGFVIDPIYSPPEIKIGYSRNIQKRITQYTQTNKHGFLAFSIPVLYGNIKHVESSIHKLLHDFNVRGEVFCINASEAERQINCFINTITTSNNFA